MRTTSLVRLSRTLTFASVFLVATVGAIMVYENYPEGRTLRPGRPPYSGQQDHSLTWIGYIPRLHVLHAGYDGLLYGMEDHFLYVSSDGGNSFERRGSLPKVGGFAEQVRNAVARTKTVRRIRNNRGPTTIEVLSSGTILVFWDQVYRSTDGGYSFDAILDASSFGMVGGPFSFGAGTAVGPDDTVYVGEYVCTPRPNSVRILRGTDDGSVWEIAYVFEAGAIFHIHSITHDPYREGFWICTGDRDEESAVFFTADFHKLDRLGGGSQDWRVVSLIVTPEFLYWGSDNDSPDGAAIFRWGFANEQLEKILHIGKVSYFATQLKCGTLAISTTYEPESRYTATSTPKASTEIWISRNGDSWTRLLELDWEPGQRSCGAAARAHIAFPVGQPLEHLFLIPLETAGNPFGTAILDLASLNLDL